MQAGFYSITGSDALRGQRVHQLAYVPETLTHLPDKLEACVGDAKVKGDLLVLRTSFQINRSDFVIKAGEVTDKVAETIALSLSIAGAAPRA